MALGNRQKKKESKVSFRKINWIRAGFVFLLFILVAFLVYWNNGPLRTIENPKVARLAQIQLPDWVQREILPLSSDSRRGVLLEDITGIAIHYVGNPGSTAAQNRSFYGNPGTKVNSHFLIGLEGEIIQCLPLEEKSSATSQRNRDTISIEVCHPDEGGKFTKESYEALIRLTAFLCIEGEIPLDGVIRHYDATGKLCPLYYVENEEAWEQMRADIGEEMVCQTLE